MSPPQHSQPPFFTTPCQEMGIDALERVITHISAEVQTLVSAVTQPPRTNNADLLRSLHAAFEQGSAIIAGLINASAPIHRMPPELLTKIFSLSPRAIMHGNGESQLAYWPFKAEVDTGDLHGLTKVCRYWRDIAIAASALWTTIGSGSRSHSKSNSFRRSIFLPDNPSLDLIVHLDCHKLSTSMKSMLANSPNIQELHIWETTSIPDMPSSWRFDTNTLVHCTLWSNGTSTYQRRETHSKLPFSFKNGGDKLRSLCLSELSFHVFPANGFPALTVLILSTSGVESRATMADLFKFLAGCPQLEEAYIHNIQRHASHNYFLSSLPISLPRLRYLCYEHSRSRESGWKKSADPIECLLSHTSIPSTCHLYFIVEDTKHRATSGSILDSVFRHARGKDSDAVISHLFLALAANTHDNRSSMQLVFSQGSGSVRLRFKTNYDCLDVLHSFRRIFFGTEDVRISYDSTDGYAHHGPQYSLPTSLPAIFPNVKAITLIPTVNDSNMRRYAVRWLPRYLADPPACKLASPLAPVAASAVPHPRLDTLWIFVRSKQEIVSLEEILAARARLGFSVRCVVVHHRFAADSTALAQLRALHAEEVILTEPRASVSNKQREGDWTLRFPERFSLPAAVHRDWPAMWCGADRVGEDDRRDDSESDSDSGSANSSSS